MVVDSYRSLLISPTFFHLEELSKGDETRWTLHGHCRWTQDKLFPKGGRIWVAPFTSAMFVGVFQQHGNLDTYAARIAHLTAQAFHRNDPFLFEAQIQIRWGSCNTVGPCWSADRQSWGERRD